VGNDGKRAGQLVTILIATTSEVDLWIALKTVPKDPLPSSWMSESASTIALSIISFEHDSTLL
jgi:hypothetical protein